MQDAGLHCALGPVLLQRRQDKVQLLTLLFPAQTFKVAVVQHQRVVYCHAKDDTNSYDEYLFFSYAQPFKQAVSSPVLWLSGVILHVQELINYIRGFQLMSDQKKNGHHTAYLQHDGKFTSLLKPLNDELYLICKHLNQIY